MKTVSRWGLKFTGEGDLLHHFEELAQSCHLLPDRLVPILLGVLEGNAFKWYHVAKSEVHTCPSFRAKAEKLFLASRHFVQLENSFFNRNNMGRKELKIKFWQC